MNASFFNRGGLERWVTKSRVCRFVYALKARFHADMAGEQFVADITAALISRTPHDRASSNKNKREGGAWRSVARIVFIEMRHACEARSPLRVPFGLRGPVPDAKWQGIRSSAAPEQMSS